jgi:hypothetical protein
MVALKLRLETAGLENGLYFGARLRGECEGERDAAVSVIRYKRRARFSFSTTAAPQTIKFSKRARAAAVRRNKCRDRRATAAAEKVS